MKKLLAMLVLLVMLAQVLPLDALATVGKVLSADRRAGCQRRRGFSCRNDAQPQLERFAAAGLAG